MKASGFISLSTALYAALLLSACGGDSASLHAAPLWTQVYNKTTCEVVNLANCVGAYGFSIDNQGNYIVGPSPTGQTVKGTLTSTEWSQLQTAANTVASDIAANPNPACVSQVFPTGVTDMVQINATGNIFNVQTAMNQLCAYNGGKADSTALIDLVDALRAKYYSL